MKTILPLLLALAVTGCSASPARPASAPAQSTGERSEPAAPQKAEPPPAPVAEPRVPRAFPEVADIGLVTVQGLALVGPEDASTIRVGADGSWTRSGRASGSGKLDAKQLAAVRALLDEVGNAKPSTEPGLPCDAVPSAAGRVLFGKGREIGWAGPCAGPPPPASVQILATYLQQVVDGRPASELERTLARPR